MASAGARAYNRGLGRSPPLGRAAGGGGAGGEATLKLTVF